MREGEDWGVLILKKEIEMHLQEEDSKYVHTCTHAVGHPTLECVKMTACQCPRLASYSPRLKALLTGINKDHELLYSVLWEQTC